MQIVDATHFVDRFNAHLRDCIVLFADEAFFAGDKQNEGVLKVLITEPYLAIEGKFQPDYFTMQTRALRISALTWRPKVLPEHRR